MPQRCTLVSCFVITDNWALHCKDSQFFRLDLRVLKQTAKVTGLAGKQLKKSWSWGRCVDLLIVNLRSQELDYCSICEIFFFFWDIVPWVTFGVWTRKKFVRFVGTFFNDVEICKWWLIFVGPNAEYQTACYCFSDESRTNCGPLLFSASMLFCLLNLNMRPAFKCTLRFCFNKNTLASSFY